MKKTVMRALTWLALRGRLYSVWSKIYRFMFEHKHLDKHLPPYTSFADIKAVIKEMKWRRDTWVMLWDAISHPVATYKRHTDGKKAGDCDDISLFAVWAIRDMMNTDAVDRVVEVGLLSVPWMDKGIIGGHNVCVFRYYQTKTDARSKWAHMSNWNGGMVFSPFDTMEDVVRNVLGDRISLGWAYWDDDLKLRRYDSGKTIGRQL